MCLNFMQRCNSCVYPFCFVQNKNKFHLNHLQILQPSPNEHVFNSNMGFIDIIYFWASYSTITNVHDATVWNTLLKKVNNLTTASSS